MDDLRCNRQREMGALQSRVVRSDRRRVKLVVSCRLEARAELELWLEFEQRRVGGGVGRVEESEPGLGFAGWLQRREMRVDG